MPQQQAQSRFQLVFRRFISTFARADQPLALFVDNLQWLDAATLDLLEDPLRSEIQHLMLIGAYRDNDVATGHPPMKTLGAIRAANGKVVEIKLSQLAQEHLGQLVADAVRCQPGRAVPLAQLCMRIRTEIPFSPFSSYHHSSKKDYLHSITVARAGPGISTASTPRVTPTRSLISWWGRLLGFRPRHKMRCGSWLVLELLPTAERFR